MIKEDGIYLEHVLTALHKVRNYIGDKDEDAFMKDSIIQDAVIRQFEVVGEATKRISKELKARHQEIPWKEMAGMRDILIHDYIDVDLFMVWKTAKDDVPQLIKQVEKLI